MNARQRLKKPIKTILNFFGLKFIKTGTPQEWGERKKTPSSANDEQMEHC